MTKLTNSTREEIIDSLMSYNLKSKVKELINKQWKFAFKIYDDLFTEAEQKLMKSLPEGWLRVDDDVPVQFGEGSNYYTRLSFNGCDLNNKLYKILRHGDEKLPDSIYKRLPANTSPLKVYDRRDPLSLEFDALKKEKDQIEDEYEELYQKAKGIVFQCSTANMLVKAWPEVKPFIPAELFEKGASSLIIPRDELNRSFKLPVAAA